MKNVFLAALVAASFGVAGCEPDQADACDACVAIAGAPVAVAQVAAPVAPLAYAVPQAVVVAQPVVQSFAVATPVVQSFATASPVCHSGASVAAFGGQAFAFGGGRTVTRSRAVSVSRPAFVGGRARAVSVTRF